MPTAVAAPVARLIRSRADGPLPPAVRIAASTRPLAPPAMSKPASPLAVTPSAPTAFSVPAFGGSWV
jgi:hypothetical protein